MNFIKTDIPEVIIIEPKAIFAGPFVATDTTKKNQHYDCE